VAATPAAPALSAKELDLLYRRGLAAMQQGRSDEAIRFWELVWSSSPRHAQVADYLKREYLTRGMEAFARGQLDEASAFWRRALRVDPTDARASGYLERAQKQLSRTREILGSND
jgi:tetratricopeptide (TPR) repeat protein